MKLITTLLQHIIRRRRILAVVAAMVSVLAICSVVNGRSEPTTLVYTAAVRIDAGTVPTSSQITQTSVPTTLVPTGAITASQEVDNHMTAVALPAGAILTTDSFASMSSTSPGHVVIPLTVSAQILSIIAPGDHVSVFWSDSTTGATTVSKGIRVVTVPAQDSSGMFSSGDSGDVILAEVPDDIVSQLTSSASMGTMLVALE